MARPEKVRLGEILVGQKLVSEEQLKLALASKPDFTKAQQALDKILAAK